jgi:hypothetical protein
MEGEFLACGRCHSGTREDRIMDMPVDAAIREIGQYQRRLCNKLTDNRSIDINAGVE